MKITALLASCAMLLLLNTRPPIPNRLSDPVTVRDSIFPCPADMFEQIDSVFDPYLEQSMELGTYFRALINNGSENLFVVAQPGEYVAIYAEDSTGIYRLQICQPLDGGVQFRITQPDLNFDKQSDILISAKDGGVHGNSFSVGFLFDGINHRFRQTVINLENLTIDPANKQLRSRHYSSVYGGNCKWLYGWQSDSLVLLGEAIIQTETIETTTYWKALRNGTMVTESLVDTSAEHAWDVFIDSLLWQGEWEVD